MTQPWMNTYWAGERAALYKADAQKIPLPDKSVHMVVTSPPYWGLRDYGLGQWEGGDAECGHSRIKPSGEVSSAFRKSSPDASTAYVGSSTFAWPNNTCGLCGAVQTPAGIGLEPTLGEWVEHIVEVMREVKRVLRDDGTCWLNLGDAYAGSWGNYGSRKGGQRVRTSVTFDRPAYDIHTAKPPGATMPDLAPKNLIGQPWRVAHALQDDGANVPALRTVERVIEEFHDAFEGEEIPPKALAILDRLAAEYAEAKGQSWVLRSAIVWHKPNPMPEAVLDRPTSSYEMVFLLTKSGAPTFWVHQDGHGSRTKPAPDYRMVEGKRVNMWRSHDYFYDAEALRTPWTESSVQRLAQPTFDSQEGGPKDTKSGNRSHRKVLENLHKAEKQHRGANARNVWTIPTQGRPDAHFATFPDELARRCIKAGTSEHGVCEECGAPWARMVETGYKKNRPSAGNDPRSRSEDKQAEGSMGGHHGWQGNNLLKETQTVGWQPTCGCNAAVVPALVLDPFVGSGTTVAVAQSLGRCGVGLDLNEEYLDIAVKYTTSGKYSWIPKEGSREQTKEMPEQLA